MHSRLLRGLVVQPQRNKDEPADTGDAYAREIWPCAGDVVRGRVLVVGHVADGDGALLLNVGQEGPLVVDHEVEDAVLVGDDKRYLVDALGLGGDAFLVLERQAVVGGEHGKLELQLVVGWDLEIVPPVPDPFGDGDGIGL